MHKSIFILIFTLLTATSCRQNIIFDHYISTELGWPQTQQIKFEFDIKDSLKPYNLFIKMRTTEDYPFSNLFLLVDLKYPSGKIQKDTLEYLMANPDGSLLGHGLGSTKEHKLWYKGHNPSFIFPETGTYQVTIAQGNRELGKVNGVEQLQGVIDIGFSVETINQ